jgi:putative spermidine/putrescine transport system ATP-binding protein
MDRVARARSPLSTDAATVGSKLRLAGLTKRYGDFVAVDHVSMTIMAGEFVTLLGPSGSGKTTTLDMIGGLTAADGGEIYLDERALGTLPAHRRGIGIVFQHYALFPHLTVFQNVAFPLRQRRLRRADIRQRVGAALDLVRLTGYERRQPRELSGGEQQRVAIARAVVFEPSLILMDEPLGALDRRLRDSLQLEIKRIHKELGRTFVYVTHDQDEALGLSDRIALFHRGKVEQVGTAEGLYQRPDSLFVAQFIGESNVFAGTVVATGRDTCVAAGDVVLRAPSAPGLAHGDAAVVVVRPESMRLLAASTDLPADHNRVQGSIAQLIYLGSYRKVLVTLRSGQTVVVREQAHDGGVASDGSVLVAWRVDDSVLLANPQGPAARPSDPALAVADLERTSPSTVDPSRV